jgi:outer membrane protein assembly factor BamD
MSYPASIARLKTLVEKYPLYSGADEALFLLGQDYEGQIAQMRARPTCIKTAPQRGCVPEQVKANMVEELTKEASAAYSQIITRYPVMDRGDDAKRRLAALHQPIPRPTKAAVAQNKAEEDSRRDSTALALMMGVVKKGPNVDLAAHEGEPTLVDPTPVAANQDAGATAMRAMGMAAGEHGLAVETVKGGVPAANDPAPRSDTPSADNSQPFAHSNTANTADPNELQPVTAATTAKPNGAQDPNELTPATDATAASNTPLPPPAQVNEIQHSQASSGSATTADASSSLASDKDVSSSKKKKKKGLKKIMPF